MRKGKTLALVVGFGVLALVLVTAGFHLDEFAVMIRIWRILEKDFDNLGPNGQGYREYLQDHS